MEKSAFMTDEFKSSLAKDGSRLARWFQISIEIRLFGVIIFKKTFPPDADEVDMEKKSSNS